MAITGNRWLARGRWLMLLAVLLSVLAPDHVFGQDGHHPAGPSHETHSQHCHGDAASCSDAPATAGASVANLAENLGAHDGRMLRGHLAASPLAPPGITREILDPPPRRL